MWFLTFSCAAGGDTTGRLQPRWITAGGVRQQDGWLDTLLKVPCTFHALNREMQCVPTERLLLIDDASGNKMDQIDSFDADCKSKLAVHSAGCAPSFPVAGLWQGGTFEDEQSTCSGLSTAPLEDRQWFLIVPVAAATPYFSYGVHQGVCCQCAQGQVDQTGVAAPVSLLVPLTARNTPFVTGSEQTP